VSLNLSKTKLSLRRQLQVDVDLLDCHQLNSERYPFFLESHGYKSPHSRFDILFAFPGKKIEVHSFEDTHFLSELKRQFMTSAADCEEHDELPFLGGWFVFLSYELAGFIEPKLSSIPVDNTLPVAMAVHIPAAIIKDHQDDTLWLVCECGADDLLEEMAADIQQLQRNNLPEIAKPTHPLCNSYNEDESESFLASIDKIKHYLKEGDTFQVNLSRNFEASLSDGNNYLDVYRSLREQNPAPFSALACIGEQVICSASPERLVKSRGLNVEMRPIAGTHPRGETPAEDANLSKELLSNQKENAEHIMLLDLIRNDLGRICQAGTVSVDENMQLESYATVHHIVSNVSGTLLNDVLPTDIISAVFPGGTITGCPKVRCMEIIHELEKAPRGAYTGSLGYINHNGDLDLNILIRTMVIEGQQLHFKTGAGIVTDSVAENELAETLHKAEGILKTLHINEH
jgi:anthranilate synthase component 1